MQIFGTHAPYYERESRGFRHFWWMEPVIKTDPEIRAVIVRQELPWHPGSIFQTGIQGPDVASLPQIGTLITRQELPWHPSSWMRRLQPEIKSPRRDFLFTTQELPYHPRLRVWTYMRDANVAQEVTKVLITRQEQPFHALWPKPIMVSGFATPSETCYGYVITPGGGT